MTAGGEAELRSQIRQALRSLTPPQREIIFLAHFQKLTLRQIAQRTGTPIGTVHERATGALWSFKDALKRSGTEF